MLRVMQAVIKVLTGAWVMNDVRAGDILIKATIRAGHIMSNFLHLEPQEHHLLTRYVNGVANSRELGCENSRKADRREPGQLRRVRSLAPFQRASSCLQVMRLLLRTSTTPRITKSCWVSAETVEANRVLGWTLQPGKKTGQTPLVLSASYHWFPVARLERYCCTFKLCY